MGAYDDWATIIGFAAVGGFAYYLHTRGTFNEIFDAISKALDEIKAASGKKEPEKKETAVSAEAELAFTYSGQSGSGRHRAYKSYNLI